MFVSIVITNYNYGEYLAEAIDSALSQSYPDKEVIVIDESSTDQSPELIASYGRSITAVFKENGGHCSAANAGFAISRGDIVIFLDADDYMTEGAISALAEPIDADPSISKSQGYLLEVDKTGTPTGRTIPGGRLSPSGDYRDDVLRRGPGACRHAFTSGNAWPAWFLRQVMPLPETRELGVDGCLNAVSTLFGRTASVHAIVGAYRVHGRNAGPVGTTFSAKSLRNRLRQIELTHEHLAHWAARLGHAVPADRWRRSGSNWRHSLLSYSLISMEQSARKSGFSEFVLSPFHTCHTNWPKALILSALLCVVRLLPRKGALALARRMLKLPKPGS